MFIPGFLRGKDGGLKKDELEKMAKINPFSEYLAANAFDPETNVYTFQDQTIGFLWECTPTVFAGERQINTLEGLFGGGIPDHSVLSFTLHADSHIGPYIDSFNDIHNLDHPLAHEFKKNFTDFLDKGRWGLEQASFIPFRNIKLIVGLKIPESSRAAQTSGWEDLRQHVEETLAGAGVRPRRMHASNYLAWSRRLFNSHQSSCEGAWNENMPLRKQIINAETAIHEKSDHMEIGDNYWRCITPKGTPRAVDPVQTNELFGGFMGMISDQDQIRTPFLYTINIVFTPLAKKLHGKCNFVLQQQAVGSFAPSLKRKQAEYLDATDKLEKGIPFVRIMPIMWVWAKTKEEALESATRVRRIWESHNFVMQMDYGILKILFLSALPFNLYANNGKTLDNLQRDMIVDTPAVAPMLPTQGDYRGAGLPKILLTGRKGQMIPLDFWAKGTNAYNALLLATTGSGKSFFSNFLVLGEFTSGARVRILDVGYSYKKLCDLFDGRMIDLTPDKPMSLNPFTFVANPSEDLESVVSCVVLMAFAANPSQMPDTIENNLIRDAVRWAWAEAKNEAHTGLIYEYLAHFPNHENISKRAAEKSNLPMTEEELSRVSTGVMVEKAQHLAFQMKEFTPQGQFGAYFKGPSEFNIREDDLVVTELQGIQGIPELYRVVVGLIMNAYQQDTYQKKDLSQNTLCVFDEAWQYLSVSAPGEGGGGGIGNQIAPVLERFARTCRKANTGILVISQSPNDITNFGAAGKAIWGNTPFKIFLESPDFSRAVRDGLIDYDDFTMKILKSVQGAKPRYSELFIESQLGRGCARLMVDPYTYYICSSSPDENAEMYQMVEEEGMSFHEAIYEMVRRHHP